MGEVVTKPSGHAQPLDERARFEAEYAAFEARDRRWARNETFIAGMAAGVALAGVVLTLLFAVAAA